MVRISFTIYLAVLTWSTFSTASNVNLEEELRQFRQDYNELKSFFEVKVSQLEKESIHSSFKIKQLNTDCATTSNNAAQLLNPLTAGKNAIFRTCREARLADPSIPSGMQWIDPDGQGVGDDPIYVYCDMTRGWTSVLHDTEAPMDVGHCSSPGCYSKIIQYNATIRQMTALADLSDACHQSFKYDCYYAPFEFNSVPYAWWNDKNGNPRYFWSGSNDNGHTCQCGIDQNCVDDSLRCNCDATAPVQLADDGVITDKNLLPITRLNFGRTQLATSSGIHTLGRFECIGQVEVNGMPTSCEDLWRIGHTLSGLYSIMGTKMAESVYCDFNKLPSDEGFQKWIGYVDVKSMPVYFYAQKNSSFQTMNTPIPFEIERLNVGNAMNLTSGIFTAPRAGTYFFSLSAIVDYVSGTGGDLRVALVLNSNHVGSTHTNRATSLRAIETHSLQSTLHLEVGDKIWLTIWANGNNNGIFYDDRNHYTHFTGWLLNEDISQFL